MKERVSFEFKEIKKYIYFLLENPAILGDIANQYFEILRHSRIPAMHFLDRLPPGQSRSLVLYNLKSFLEKVLNGNAFESIDKWREGSLDKSRNKEGEIADIIRVYDIQIQLLLNGLTHYTQEFFTFSSIFQELNQFQALLREYIFVPENNAPDDCNNLISSLINHSEDGIIAFDQYFRVTEINKIIEKWSRLNPQEIVGEHFFHAFPSYKPTEVSAEGREIQNKVLNGEKVNIPERPFPYKEGFCKIEIIPLLNSDEIFSGGVCFVHETTEKRKTSKELRESQTLLRKVADTSPCILFVYDLEQGRNIFINRTIEHVLGYEVDEFGGLVQDIYNSLFHPEDVEKGILHIGQMKNLRDGEVLEVEYRMKDSKGQWHWFRSLDTVFKRNENGEVIQVLGNAQDITKEKEVQDIILNKNKELTSLLEELQIAERKLRKSNEELEQRVVQRTKELVESENEVKRREEQLRSIGDAMPVFIAFMRSDKTFGYVNKAYEGFFHVKKEEIIGKPVREVIGEESFKNQEEYIEKCLKGESVKFENKREYFGSSKWFNITFLPKKIDGETVGIYVLVEDVTEFKEIQFELEALLKQLESANEEKSVAL